MCKRLKRLQKKRTVVDKAIEEEEEKVKNSLKKKEE
jgi:vacuolar-type H+-ATPase subunit E/Vma4